MKSKKLKIYDIDALLRQECNKQAFRYHKVAIFESSHGVVVAEEEVVHQKEASLQSTIEIPANDIAQPGHTCIRPSYIVTIAISDVKDAPFTEMNIEDFLHRRSYNPRSKTNWRILLTSLGSIGFDIQEYLASKPALNQIIRSAEGRRDTVSSQRQSTVVTNKVGLHSCCSRIP